MTAGEPAPILADRAPVATAAVALHGIFGEILVLGNIQSGLLLFLED
jgi:hypothetical protein